VQRSTVLESIARDGHVGQLVIAGNPESGPGDFQYTLVGINEATTFPGICNRHDSELFRPIETKPLTFAKDQVFLLGYRALLRECYTKLQAVRQMEFMRKYRDRHPELKDPISDEYVEGATLGNKHGYEALLHHKKIYDELWRKSDFEKIRFVAFIYDRATPLLSASAFSPEYDFGGNLIQDFGDLAFIQDFISYCIWSVNNRGVALLAWHESSDKSCKPFIQSLLRQPHQRVSAQLTSLAFEHSENLVFSPSWWEALSRSNRQILENRMRGGLSTSELRSPHYLQDEGHTAISAKISEILSQTLRF
jgi:hypothetical protein